MDEGVRLEEMPGFPGYISSGGLVFRHEHAHWIKVIIKTASQHFICEFTSSQPEVSKVDLLSEEGVTLGYHSGRMTSWRGGDGDQKQCSVSVSVSGSGFCKWSGLGATEAVSQGDSQFPMHTSVASTHK